MEDIWGHLGTFVSGGGKRWDMQRLTFRDTCDVSRRPLKGVREVVAASIGAGVVLDIWEGVARLFRLTGRASGGGMKPDLRRR
jgi:hypothetical protein